MAVLKRRILVEFDVDNQTHKNAYEYFLKNAKWEVNSPRFILEDGFSSIPNMIADKLLKYYLSKELAL